MSFDPLLFRVYQADLIRAKWNDSFTVKREDPFLVRKDGMLLETVKSTSTGAHWINAYPAFEHAENFLYAQEKTATVPIKPGGLSETFYGAIGTIAYAPTNHVPHLTEFDVPTKRIDVHIVQGHFRLSRHSSEVTKEVIEKYANWRTNLLRQVIAHSIKLELPVYFPPTAFFAVKDAEKLKLEIKKVAKENKMKITEGEQYGSMLLEHTH